MTDLLGKSNRAAKCGPICSAYVLVNGCADSNRADRCGYHFGVYYDRSHGHGGVCADGCDADEHAYEHDGADVCHNPCDHDRIGAHYNVGCDDRYDGHNPDDCHGDGDDYDVHVDYDRDHGDAHVVRGGYDPAQMNIDVSVSDPHPMPGPGWKGQPCQPAMPL